MRHSLSRCSLAAFVVTLSLGVARFAFSDGPDDHQPGAGNGGPLILTLGPPPVVYSPSADFGARVESTPGWAVASDALTAAVKPNQPVVGTPPMLPSCVPQSGPFDTTMPLGAIPCFECPPPMRTAMQPQPVYGAPSYYAPAPNPAFMLPTMPVPAPPTYGFAVPAPSAPSPGPAYNPSVVYPSRLAATPAPVTHSIYFSSPAAGEADHLEHVLQAIHHLEAAGMQAQADQLRRECDDKVERLIECFKSNEAEISRLHQSTANIRADSGQAAEPRPVQNFVGRRVAEQVTAQLCILNVDLKKLDTLKLESKDDAIKKFVKAFKAQPHGGFESFQGEPTELSAAIESLHKQRVVEILSRPAIATASGQEAYLQIGQSIPQAAFTAAGEPCMQQSFVGTSASIRPEVVDQDTVRMIVKIRCTESGDQGSMHELESIVQAHCGEQVFLSGLRTVDGGRTVAKLIVICPQIVKNDDLPPPLPVAANSGYSCGAAPCGEAVQPASVNFEACPTSESSAGACKCASSAACGGECGDHCTCGSAAGAANDQTSASKKQIVLHVELLELNHSKARQIGFDFAEGKMSFSNILSAPHSRGFVDALKKEGVIKVLSNPTICTLSGRAAHFQCGEEIPVPTKHSDGSVSVQYHNVGTQIDCVPIVQDDGKLRLEFRARLSAIDAGRKLDVGDLHVPCFAAREFDTASELKSGQALVVLGPAENGLVAEMVQVNCMPDFVESIVDSLGGYFEEHPLVGGAVLGALDQLGCCYTRVERVHHEEELQFVAIVRPEFGDSNAAQPVFDARNFGCDLGCCDPNACAGQCASATCEALRQPLRGSFAVQPAACWGVPSTGKLLFDHVLIDTPLLPGAVQPALFMAPQSIGSKSLFDFDFQTPVLPPLEFTLPDTTPVR